MKDIYKLNLHESTEIECEHIKWHVTRVPSGWIYSHVRLDSGSMVTTFVPFDNKFEYITEP